MSHSLPLDTSIERLTSLFRINETYSISFGEHSSTSKLLEARKSKGKDQNKKVKKVDGKLAPCWYLRFEDFECFLVLEKIKDIQLTTTGAKIIFSTYVLEIVCKS